MKKQTFTLLLFCLIFAQNYAQQWIDKKYTYDSLLNVTYGTALNFNGEMESLKMDIFLPNCDDVSHSSLRPLLLWIHGGAFLAGDKNDASIQDLCKKFAKRGYVTASIDYRLGFISDDNYWQCNYPNYPCVFAIDSAEWARAYYRAVQDAKGALRYLINRHATYRIDTDNVFVAGESAGAFTALGVGLLDTLIEKPIQAGAIASTPLPHVNSQTCSYNQGKVFTGTSIARPDLGGIEGEIEPSNLPYTIKGIGNFYGGMYRDLLKYHRPNQPKPAIFSFHQPCDIVVPIDSGNVFWGLSWCFTNGYNCYAIANNHLPIYGSRVISKWNTNNNYGYTIHNEFTTINFPYSYLIGQGSCLDQVNNPCHAYDNKTLRENNLAQFFANLITTSPICDTAFVSSVTLPSKSTYSLYPNPVQQEVLHLVTSHNVPTFIKNVEVTDLAGKVFFQSHIVQSSTQIDINLPEKLQAGVYLLKITLQNESVQMLKFVKN